MDLSERSVGLDVIVRKNAQGGAIQIFILAAAQRPQKGREAGEAERERNRDEIYKDIHDAPAGNVSPMALVAVRACGRARTRNALSVTIIDEPDIAAAAISGVA